MQIETKFSNRDKVWHIKQDMRYEWEECKFCGAKGEIMGFNQEFSLCPVCVGKKGWNEPRMLAWGVEGPLTIGEIRVRIRGGDPVGSYKDPDLGSFIPNNYGPQEAEYEEQYMCKETGIGSGRVYDADTLFATEAEALEECRAKNSDQLSVGSDQKARASHA